MTKRFLLLTFLVCVLLPPFPRMFFDVDLYSQDLQYVAYVGVDAPHIIYIGELNSPYCLVAELIHVSKNF
jgi:hypothetical protein